jgi:hypothetical protein
MTQQPSQPVTCMHYVNYLAFRHPGLCAHRPQPSEFPPVVPLWLLYLLRATAGLACNLDCTRATNGGTTSRILRYLSMLEIRVATVLKHQIAHPEMRQGMIA